MQPTHLEYKIGGPKEPTVKYNKRMNKFVKQNEAWRKRLVYQIKTSSLLKIFCTSTNYSNSLQTLEQWLLKIPSLKSAWITKSLKHLLNEIASHIDEGMTIS